MPPASPVLIVGAGLAGLVAANALAQSGRAAIVLDKAVSPGGRLATRRMPGVGGRSARLDHGAQFFTVRSPDFAELVHGWRRGGIVREWCRGFTTEGDGYPRYCAEAGMNTIAAFLAATVDVRCSVTVHSVGGHDGALSVIAADGTRWESSAVILTPPVPQSLALCDNGWLPLPAPADEALRSVLYASCLALLVTIDGPGAVPYPGGRQLSPSEHPVFSFVADNLAKGISEVPAITFHCNDEVSAERYDEGDDDLCAYLLREASDFLGDALIVGAQIKRWRYARPILGHPSACVVVSPIDDTTLVFAGDGFGPAKVEGAALSGLAAAEAVLLAG